MAAGIDRLAKQIATMLKKDSPTGYDTTATVTRVEGGTAWVHIPGGVDETPVSRTINARVGDSVQIRVSGGRAFIVGNGTAPPTDDVRANEAINFARVANSVARKAGNIADKAFHIAGNTAQYFWTTETGTDTGAHITEKPKEEFVADPTNGGANLLLRSIGIAVRNGLTELASFSANGISIGTNSKTRITLDSTNGLKLGQKVQVNASGDASFSGTISASSGEFTEGFKVDSPLSGSQTARFSIDADSQGNEIDIAVTDGTNQAMFDINRYGAAEIYGTLRASLVAGTNGEAVINAGGRDVAKGTGDRFICEDWTKNGFRTPVTTVDTSGERIGYMSTGDNFLWVYGQWRSTGGTYSGKSIVTSSSDARLKKNVEDCSVDALELIKRIRMREFDWLHTDEHQKIGFIADELEKLDPKLAVGGGYTKDGTMNVKSVDVFYLIGYLVKAIQELSTEVESLRRETNGNHSEP